MTTEQLDELIKAGRVEDVAAAFRGLSEQDRRALADHAYQWYREIRDGKGRGEAFLRIGAVNKARSPYHVSALSVLATGNLKRACAVNVFWFAVRESPLLTAVVEVLDDRRPGWASRWLEKGLEGENFASWELTEALIEKNICQRPTSDDFIRHFGDRFNQWDKALRPRLKARPHLLEQEIWRLFEVPSAAFAQDASKYSGTAADFETWESALVGLAGEGVISRDKLLSCALSGLARDFTQNIQSGILRLIDRLKPTPEELQKRQEILHELLGSPASHVAKFALGACRKIEHLDEEAFLTAAKPVLRQKVKGNGMTLLKFAARLVDENPARRAAALPLFEAALHHAHRDVREWAERWLREQGVGTPEFAEDVESSSEPECLDLRDLQEPWVSLLGLDDDGFPAPMSYSLGDVPILAGVERLEPITELQELIDTVARSVELTETGDEVERILGGLSRLCDQRPPDFSVRTEALARRIEEYPAAEAVRGLVAGWAGVCRLLKHLLLCWLRGSRVPLVESTYYKAFPLYPFFRTRLLELTERVLRRERNPLLSEPTHADGWIDPVIFAQRLTEYEGVPGSADLIQALLRLTPGGREQAWEIAQAYRGEFAAQILWALGAEGGPSKRRQHPEVWLAAARSREPNALLNLPGLPTQALSSTSYRWSCVWVGNEYKFPRLEWDPGLEAEPKTKKGPLTRLKETFSGYRSRKELMPTLLCHAERSARAWETPDFQGAFPIRWLATIWPQNLDSYWRQACDALLERLDIDTATTFPNFAYLDPLFERDRSWDGLARLTLCLALVSKDADVAGLGVDALIESIEDGRAHPQPLGETLLELHRAEFLKPNRLKDQLRQVAEVSAFHRRFVAEIVGVLLCEPLPKGGYHLLELMLDVADGLPDGARNALSGDSAGGKTGKLIKRLLKTGPPKPLDAFRTQALRGRVERARRFQEASDRSGAIGWGDERPQNGFLRLVDNERLGTR